MNTFSLKTAAATCATLVVLAISVVEADVKTYRETLKSTAWVLAKSDGSTSSGTGVLVDSEKKLLLTNYHVVGEARTAVVFFPDVKNQRPQVERKHYLKNVKKLGVRGRVLGVDRKRDLALVQLEQLPKGVQQISLAEESAAPGEQIQSIGNSGSSDALWVYTSGTVRSVYQKQFRTGSGEHDFLVLETQSPINPGDSGGPVVNGNGELVGISQSLSPKARLVTYSVDITEVKTFLAADWKPAPLPVTTVLEKAELNYESIPGSKDALLVTLKEKDQDGQVVFVTKDTEYFGQADVRKVWALAATLEESPSTETMMKLLQQSAQTKLGAWSIERSQSGQYLVLYVCKVDATATPQALKSTMQYVAKLSKLASKDLQPQPTAQDADSVLSDWLTN